MDFLYHLPVDLMPVCARVDMHGRSSAGRKRRHPLQAVQQPADVLHRAATHGYAAFVLTSHGCIFMPYEVIGLAPRR